MQNACKLWAFVGTLRKKATIHQVTTMLATSENNHLLTTGTDNPTLWLSPERQNSYKVRAFGQLAKYYDYFY